MRTGLAGAGVWAGSVSTPSGSGVEAELTLRAELCAVGPRECVLNEALQLVIAARLCACARTCISTSVSSGGNTQLVRFVVYVFMP